MNTAITFFTVWLLHEVLDWDVVLSNFLGFVAGGLNSYIMNRIWNFKNRIAGSVSDIERFVK